MNRTQFFTVILTLSSTPAFAQSSSGGGFVGSIGTFLPITIILVIWYFIFRWRKKREKKYRELLEQRFVDIENRLDKLET